MDLTPGSPLDSVVENFAVGAILEKGYDVLDIRRGGMGEVFIVREFGDGEELTVALKSFQKPLFFTRECRHAFVHEVAIWMSLTGEPFIMPALGLVYLDDRPFVRMPVRPKTVRDLLRQGPLETATAVRIAFQVAVGMRAAERRLVGIVHGDLKPENLLVGDPDGGILISDFGLARAAGIGQGSATLETTWAYRAPESWSPGSELSSATDIYAFGVILYELATTRRPFDAESRADWELAHRGELPKPIGPRGEPTRAVLVELGRRCLARNPDDRPANFEAVFDTLNEMLHEVDPVLAFTLVVEGFEARERAIQVGALLRDEVALTLSKLGEFELALRELESRPATERSVQWQVAYGDVLSMLDRDLDALEPLRQAAAATEATDSERNTALSSLGLSLKRLGRFDQAIEIFERLRRDVPDHELPAVVVNLATVYLQKREPQTAVRLLQPIAPAHPDNAQLWANLGFAYEQLGDGDLALNAFSHALRAAPHMGELYVHRARVLMDQYRAVADAALALDLAFRQGFDSREWYVRTRACNILLEDERATVDLEQALRGATSDEIVDAMNIEAAQLVEQLRAGEGQ